MPTFDEITTGELARRIDRVERQLADGFKEVNRTIESQQFVHVDRYDADTRANDRRVAALESTLKWQARTLGGALLAVLAETLLLVFVARGGS
jgi:hypothetical protein